MDRLIPVAVATIIVLVIVGAAIQVSYCAFWGDPESARYWAICQADD